MSWERLELWGISCPRGVDSRTSELKALVVDADLRTVRGIGAALRSGGYHPLEATSFEAAKQLWVTEHPQILIADVRLGQFNGLQLLLRARAERPDVLAVITCAFPDNVLEQETRRFGGMFLVKPEQPKEVIAMILDFLSKARSAGPIFQERRNADRRRTVLPSAGFDRRAGDRRHRHLPNR